MWLFFLWRLFLPIVRKMIYYTILYYYHYYYFYDYYYYYYYDYYSAQYYYHMLSAGLGMGEGERASTSAGSRAISINIYIYIYIIFILYYIILYYVILCYIILYCIILQYTLYCYIILCYIILYYIILYYSILSSSRMVSCEATNYWAVQNYDLANPNECRALQALSLFNIYLSGSDFWISWYDRDNTMHLIWYKPKCHMPNYANPNECRAAGFPCKMTKCSGDLRRRRNCAEKMSNPGSWNSLDEHRQIPSRRRGPGALRPLLAGGAREGAPRRILVVRRFRTFQKMHMKQTRPY